MSLQQLALDYYRCPFRDDLIDTFYARCYLLAEGENAEEGVRVRSLEKERVKTFQVDFFDDYFVKSVYMDLKTGFDEEIRKVSFECQTDKEVYRSLKGSYPSNVEEMGESKVRINEVYHYPTEPLDNKKYQFLLEVFNFFSGGYVEDTFSSQLNCSGDPFLNSSIFERLYSFARTMVRYSPQDNYYSYKDLRGHVEIIIEEEKDSTLIGIKMDSPLWFLSMKLRGGVNNFFNYNNPPLGF